MKIPSFNFEANGVFLYRVLFFFAKHITLGKKAQFLGICVTVFQEEYLTLVCHNLGLLTIQQKLSLLYSLECKN